MTAARRLLIATVVAAVALGACTSKPKAKAPPSAKRTLRVAVLYTTAGRSGDLAQAVLGGAGLVVDQAKALNVTLELVQLDYAGDAKKVPALVAQARAKADAILVGTADPAVDPALREIVDLPILYPLLPDDSLLAGRTNAFRFGPSNRQQANVLVRYLTQKRGYKRIAVLADDTPFGKEGGADVVAALNAAGMSPAMDARFTPGKDIHTPVARAGQLNVDAMVVWTGSEGEAARIVVEEQKMSFGYQLALSGNLANSTFAKNATSQVTPVAFRDGILSVGPWAGPWFRLARIISFYVDFQTENSAQAPVPAAQVHDAALALAHAASQRGTTPPELIGGLEALQDFAGAGVPLSFAADSHEGMNESDLAIWGFTKEQSSAGGEFFPEVDTGGGFFTIVNASLDLPKDLAFLARGLSASPEGSPSP